MVSSSEVPGIYTGQVERDTDGTLWAVLYKGEPTADAVIAKERVRSTRAGRRFATAAALFVSPGMCAITSTPS